MPGADALPALVAAVLVGCGATGPLVPSYSPLPVGHGPRYRPPPGTGRPVGGLTCRPALGARRGLHVELFAHRHVILVPSGIGVAGALRDGPYVRSGRCFYPLVTLEPTGVVELAAGGRPLRLGDLFALWGQPLSPTRLAGFDGGRVQAYVNGRQVAGDPSAIALQPHLEIVLETAGHVDPHPAYRFAPGL